MLNLRYLANAVIHAHLRFQQANSVLPFLAASSMSIHSFRDEVVRGFGDFYLSDREILDGLMPWERKLYGHIKPGERVLLVGCGSGRDLLPLLEQGCEVVGVEPAARPLARAQEVISQRRLTARLVGGYFEDVDLSGAFDVISFSYFCYSYIPVRRRRIEALRKARRHLAAGGRVFVSYVDEPRRGRGRAVRIARVCGALVRSDWRLEAGDRVRLGALD
ncbi:MAG: class I SAM-dependent methyltransferase, partial [Gemmatimonadales bacterium]